MSCRGSVGNQSPMEAPTHLLSRFLWTSLLGKVKSSFPWGLCRSQSCTWGDSCTQEGFSPPAGFEAQCLLGVALSACTRSISTCAFVLLQAGHPHWLSPSPRGREGQAIQGTQQFAVQTMYKQTCWREISLWTFSPVWLWRFAPCRLDGESAKPAEQEMSESLWEF